MSREKEAEQKLMFQLVINQVLGWIISASCGMWNNTDLHGFASDLINLFLLITEVDTHNRAHIRYDKKR